MREYLKAIRLSLCENELCHSRQNFLRIDSFYDFLIHIFFGCAQPELDLYEQDGFYEFIDFMRH